MSKATTARADARPQDVGFHNHSGGRVGVHHSTDRRLRGCENAAVSKIMRGMKAWARCTSLWAASGLAGDQQKLTAAVRRGIAMADDVHIAPV
jgi:hypothetical protein